MPEYTPYPVEMITPEGPVFDGEAQMIVVPGAEGQLGILSRHAPLISVLDPGETHIVDESGDMHRYATGSGFVEVHGNHAVVLVDEAVPATDIDVADAEARLERARQELERLRAGGGEDGDGDEGRGDRYRLELEVEFAENLVRVARGG
jgi:F-type H+-transporting ATPase subunit epsilon